MNIQILSIKAFKYYKKYLDKNIKVVMSTSTDDKLKEVKSRNKLVLYYDDNLKDFTTKMAKQIKRFIKRTKDNQTIYCLCDGGMSRSAAIAAALQKYYNNNDNILNDKRYTPNKLVYKTLLQVLKEG